MNVSVFCTTFWDNYQERAEAKRVELLDWSQRVSKHLPDAFKFLSTGCCDDLSLNPTKLPCINSGAPKTKAYDVWNWSYFLCAFESALWFSWHNLPMAEVLIGWESNCWVNRQTNIQKLLDEFEARKDLIMAPQYHGSPDFNFIAMKRGAIPKFQHHRRRGNLVESDKKAQLAEIEMGEIFKNDWWNPWPEVLSIRQEYGVPPPFHCIPNDEAMRWPLVALPSPIVQQHILA